MMFIYDANGVPLGLKYRNSTYAQSVWDSYWYFTQYTGSLTIEWGNLLEFKNPFIAEASIETQKIDISPEEYLSHYYSGYETLYLYGDYSQSVNVANDYNNSDYGGYNLITNNCAHYIEEVLSAGQNNYDIVNVFHNNKITIPSVLHYGTVIANAIGNINSKISSWWDSLAVRLGF